MHIFIPNIKIIDAFLDGVVVIVIDHPALSSLQPRRGEHADAPHRLSGGGVTRQNKINQLH
jgi:hypothetical protein